MKKIVAILLTFLTVFVAIGTISVSNAKADDVQVTGTVAEGSSTSLIKLDTKDGQMLLKVDDAAVLKNCKNLTKGASVVVTISYGKDSYWHIKDIKKGEAVKTQAQVDKKNISSVTGTILTLENDVLYFNTEYGVMQIKLDDSTDYSACTAMISGATYKLNLGYGSDAYMHALSISDVTSASSSASTSTTTNNNGSKSDSAVKTDATVYGSINSKSTDSLLVLDTNEGQMQIKLDQYEGGLKILVPGQKITVGINYGNEYWHAKYISR